MSSKTPLFFSLLLLCFLFPLFEGKPGEPTKAQFSAFFKNISFVHIPKNGGSAMENTIKRLSGFSVGFQSFRDRSTQSNTWHVNTSHYCTAVPKFNCGPPALCPEGGVCAYWHVPPYTYRKPYNPWLLKEIRFCHIRNPFTRAVSEYYFSHRAMKRLPPPQVKKQYLPLLNSLSSKPVFLQNGRRALYFDGIPHKQVHQAHNQNIDSLSPDEPTIVIPFPETGSCYMNPHEHCHNIPESRFVEPFVTADYIQDLYYYLQNTDMDCSEILRTLEKKHTTPETRSTGLNCNFPLRFEQYTHDFNLLLQKCGPFPDYVYPGTDHPDDKYEEILNDEKIRGLIEGLFWEDVARFGYVDPIQHQG